MIIEPIRITRIWTEKFIGLERGYLNIFKTISNLILDKASELLKDSEGMYVPSFHISIPLLEIIKKEFPNKPDFEYGIMLEDIGNRINAVPPKGFRQDFHSYGEFLLVYKRPPSPE